MSLQDDMDSLQSWSNEEQQPSLQSILAQTKVPAVILLYNSPFNLVTLSIWLAFIARWSPDLQGSIAQHYKKN